MKTLKILFFFIALFLVLQNSFAQTSGDSVMVHIETKDGNEFTGNVVRQDAETIYLQTQNFGELAIKKTDIKSKERIQSNQFKNGEVWFANPQSTRYFWSPNGYGLKEGEGYYQNVWVLWNQFAYGFTENFSIGGAMVPLFLFGGTPTPVFGTAKFSFPLKKEKINIGVGAIAGTVIGELETGFGIVYGLSTFGSHDKNLTVGLGYGFGGGEWASAPTVNLNGMLRLTNRWYLLSENYFITVSQDNAVVMSMGGRWIIKKAALDFGLVLPVIEDTDFVALPWLGFTIPFGKVN